MCIALKVFLLKNIELFYILLCCCLFVHILKYSLSQTCLNARQQSNIRKVEWRHSSFVYLFFVYFLTYNGKIFWENTLTPNTFSWNNFSSKKVLSKIKTVSPNFTLIWSVSRLLLLLSVFFKKKSKNTLHPRTSWWIKSNVKYFQPHIVRELKANIFTKKIKIFSDSSTFTIHNYGDSFR